MQLNSGQIFANRYRILQLLGEGGFGRVYSAEDTATFPPHIVAVKIIHPELLADPQILNGFKNEASALLRLDHPHIIKVISMEITPQQAYIVTELVKGGSLAKKMQPDPFALAQPMALDWVAYYLEQIAEALDYTHTTWGPHRDLKPENILLDENERVKLADFGVALPQINHSRSSRLLSAEAWGTPEYAAPEVWDDKVSRASDIYALGVLLFQMISGQTPYSGTPPALLKHHTLSPIPRLAERAASLSYPKGLDTVLAKALAKNPKDRPPTALELHRLFKAALENSPVASGRPPLLQSVRRRLDEAGEKLAWRTAIAASKELLKEDSRLRGYAVSSLTRLMTKFEASQQWQVVAEIGNYIITLDKDQSAWRLRTARATAEAKAQKTRLEELNQALKLAPTNSEMYLERARLQAPSAANEALDDYKKAIQLSPTNNIYRSELAHYYFTLAEKTLGNNPDRAIKYYAKAIETSPQLIAHYYYKRGLAYQLKGNKRAARTDFRRAINLGHREARDTLRMLY